MGGIIIVTFGHRKEDRLRGRSFQRVIADKFFKINRWCFVFSKTRNIYKYCILSGFGHWGLGSDVDKLYYVCQILCGRHTDKGVQELQRFGGEIPI